MKIRAFEPRDARALIGLIRALAEYESLPPPGAAAARRLLEDVGRRIHVLIAESEGEAVGYAIYFFSYRSFAARPVLYLEDLFVLPVHRRGGIGRRFFAALRAAAKRERCARIEWVVLDWNRPAQRFYRELGARPLAGWVGWGLELGSRPTRRARNRGRPGTGPRPGSRPGRARG
jgi:GNAT superfamily N-acetyltransferase